MRHIRIPRRERIRKSEVVKVVDNTQGPTDPRDVILNHLAQISRIVDDTDLFKGKDISSIKRSIIAIQNKVTYNE